MKLAILALAALIQATPPATPDPKLSTADIIAINSLENQKQQIQQQEQAILQEFAVAHPGWHILPFPPFQVVKDQAPVPPKKP